jgi:hypothetical protein
VKSGSRAGRFFRDPPSNGITFPHPKARKDQDRNDEKLKNGGVRLSFRRRTINVTKDRKAKEDVNPAKNRTLGALVHEELMDDL